MASAPRAGRVDAARRKGRASTPPKSAEISTRRREAESGSTPTPAARQLREVEVAPPGHLDVVVDVDEHVRLVDDFVADDLLDDVFQGNNADEDVRAAAGRLRRHCYPG